MRHVAGGALLGLAASSGLLLVLAWLSARRPPRIAARIRPYVLGTAVEPDASTTWSSFIALALPHRAISSSGGLDLRLQRAGFADTRAQYRLEQVAWSAACACCGGLIAAVASAPVPWGIAVLCGVGAVVGVLARDRRLARSERLRARRLDDELPTAIELLAFAISSGETPHGAIVRVSRTIGGELAFDFAEVAAQVRSGVSLEIALRSMSERSASAALGRFVDSLLVAMERGTPLADVMRAQAVDARAEGRRRLMELAGRKDVAMLVPVVFLILPTVVIVALFPGLQSLRLVAP